MERALYHPELGYYAKPTSIIGRRGDYFTNVTVGALFGRLMAAQFERMWRIMECPLGFAVVEQGANDGQFAHDVLCWARAQAPEFFSEMRYWIIEPLSHLRVRQERALQEFSGTHVRWLSSLSEPEEGALTGVFFCNELVDAFPVHIATYHGGMWFENFVDFDRRGFHFVFAPPSSEKLMQHMERRLPAGLSEGYQTEVNMRALDWIGNVARLLRRGYVLIVDYGYARPEFFAQEHSEGTLATYSSHRRGGNPFELVGEADLTAHVEFTSLAEDAVLHGLDVVGFADQHHFMVGAAREAFAAIESSGTPISEATHADLRCFATLMHPAQMGLAFKYLVLARGVGIHAGAISGLEFAPDPVRALAMA